MGKPAHRIQPFTNMKSLYLTNPEFSIGLASRDFGKSSLECSIEAACALAACTETPPELALEAINARVMAAGNGVVTCSKCGEYEMSFDYSAIERTLVRAYTRFEVDPGIRARG